MDELQKYEWIEQWMAGQLKGTALKDFEAALKTDKELAELAEMHQDLNRTLAKSKKNALRETLMEISGKSSTTTAIKSVKSSSKISPQLLLGLILLVALLGLLFILFGNKNKPLEKSKPPIIIEQEEPTIESAPLPEEKSTIIPPIKNPKKEPQTIPSEKKPSKKKNPKPDPKATESLLIAANFEPNPRLEDEMQEFIRGNNSTLSLAAPLPNAQYSIQAKSTLIVFQGTVESKLPEEEIAIQLMLFDNTKNAFEQMRPTWQIKLPLQSVGDEQYAFKSNNKLELHPGLYYYIFEDINED